MGIKWGGLDCGDFYFNLRFFDTWFNLFQYLFNIILFTDILLGLTKNSKYYRIQSNYPKTSCQILIHWLHL